MKCFSGSSVRHLNGANYNSLDSNKQGVVSKMTPVSPADQKAPNIALMSGAANQL